VPWFDDKGNTVSAHGANIVKDNGNITCLENATTIRAMRLLGLTVIPPQIYITGNLNASHCHFSNQASGDQSV
jgi:hypothetical protein